MATPRLTCTHTRRGCCDTCFADWQAVAAANRAHLAELRARWTAPVDRPGRDLPADRCFPDSDAWLDRDGTVHGTAHGTGTR